MTGCGHLTRNADHRLETFKPARYDLDMSRRRLGRNQKATLRALYADATKPFSTAEIGEAIGAVAAGNLYQTCRKLEDHDLVMSSWERPEEAALEHRPPRRYYRLTGKGIAYVQDVLLLKPSDRANDAFDVIRTGLGLGSGAELATDRGDP